MQAGGQGFEPPYLHHSLRNLPRLRLLPTCGSPLARDSPQPVAEIAFCSSACPGLSPTCSSPLPVAPPNLWQKSRFVRPPCGRNSTLSVLRTNKVEFLPQEGGTNKTRFLPHGSGRVTRRGDEQNAISATCGGGAPGEGRAPGEPAVLFFLLARLGAAVRRGRGLRKGSAWHAQASSA